MAKKDFEYTNEELAEISRACLDFHSPAFQLYVNDILGSNKILMMEPEGLAGYVMLLFVSWNEKDCGIPTDTHSLVRLSRLLPEQFNKVKNSIMSNFFEYKGRFYNRRLLLERKKQINMRNQRTEALRKRYEKPTGEKIPVNEDEDEDESKEVKDNSRKVDILNYFIVKGYPVSEAEEFFNHYESQGWVTGNGIPIVNWRVKAENWHKEQMRRISDKPKPEYKQKIDNSTYRQAFVKKLDDCENGCGKKGTMRFGERKILVCSKRCGEEFEEKNKNAFSEIEKLVAGMKA